MSNLISLLENQVTESDTTESQVGAQRERNHRFYALQPLGNEQKGRSQYIDPAVFGSVEDKKSVYSESFLSSRQVVRFNGENKEESDAKTAYCQRTLKANNYTEIFRDGWHDAFVAKRMTVWVDWRKDSEQVTLRFTGAPSQLVNQQLAQMGEIINVNRDDLQSYPIPSIGQQQYVHSGTLVVEVNKSYIAIDLIQPEYVMRDPTQTYSRDALWNTARMDMSKLSLVDWGFDPDDIASLDLEYRWGSSEEDHARKSYDRSQNSTSAAGRSSDQGEVTIYKTRTWLSPDDVKDIDGIEPATGAAIYEIYWGHGRILKWADGSPAVQVMDEMAVWEWAEFKVSHAENAMCTADVEAHQQKAASGLKRGIMDNMNITNNPRWEANPDGIRDMRDLRDNAIGGIIETEGPVGQVKALETPMLSPLVMGVMQMLERDGEQRSGMSDLSNGMNMGAVNNQNSGDMIEKLAAAGQRRVAMGVRDFANTFFIPLLQCIVRFGIKYDKSQDVMESAGKQIPIAPSQWQDDEHEMEVEVALTPKEAQDMTIRLLGLDARMREDEELKPLYGVKQKHAMYDTIFELMGIKDSTKFLASPESPEYQQMARMRGEEAQKQKQIQEAMQQGQYKLAMSNDKREWDKANWAKTNDLSDNMREDEKFAWQKDKDQQELDIERNQERPVAIN